MRSLLRIAPQARGGLFGGTAGAGKSGIGADRMVHAGGFVNAVPPPQESRAGPCVPLR